MTGGLCLRQSHATATIPHTLPVAILLPHIIIDWILSFFFAMNVPGQPARLSVSQQMLFQFSLLGDQSPFGLLKQTLSEGSQAG